jgi:sodium-dependent dicarboxylate transporter 2/3/5
MWNSFNTRQQVGLIVGPLLFILMLIMPTPAGMSPEAARVAAVAFLMASLWISEAVPIPATAMLPIFLFPTLRVMSTAETTLSYGNQINFLYMGGFMIAIAMQRWDLHRRIALNIIVKVGSNLQFLLLGFMLATALLSMWISNTATAMMMVPVAMAIIEQHKRHEHMENTPMGDDPFGLALMLGIAYAASIGGVSTLVGTPPNAVLAGIAETVYGIEIIFFDWMKLGVPVSACMLAITWFILQLKLRHVDKSDEENNELRASVKQELLDMGPITIEEKRVAMVFGTVAVAWILRGLISLPALSMVADSAIAMLGAFVLFLLPAQREEGAFLLDWETAKDIPWDVIILMGGGFALAAGFSESGLTEWLANQLSILQGVHFFIIIGAVVVMVTFLTEMTSNAATATLFIPVMGALAASMGLHPFALMVPAALAASMAFMLPVATPPNAIVFASRQIRIAQMAQTGIVLNLLAAVAISIISYLLLPLIV